MGQCMSRKAAGALAASAAVSSNGRPKKMHKNQQLFQSSPDDETNKPRSPTDSNKKSAGYSRGVAMSFGFKRRPMSAPSIAANSTAARRLANAPEAVSRPASVSEDYEDAVDTDSLTNNAAPTGRSTPRLPAPKKEAAATRVSRFGFRQNQATRQNKVADLNGPPLEFGARNANNAVTNRPVTVAARHNVGAADNRNRMKAGNVAQPPQMGRFTLQSTHLPRPEPIRVIETKTAKTLANNNRRVAGMYRQADEQLSSKEGSLTEDSGVGSHVGGYAGDYDCVPGPDERRDGSPTFGARRRGSLVKPRQLEVIVKANNTFEVRDMDDSNDSCDSIAPPPLPQLPSAFNCVADNKKSSLTTNAGLVRDRAIEYQRRLDRDQSINSAGQRLRKVSVTSSEGFVSDDYGEEEKTYRDRFRSEKSFIKAMPTKTFLKSRANELKSGACDSSPPSSDEQEWVHGGEAMADEISFSMSSSDESKDKNQEISDSVPISAAVIGSALQSLMSGTLSKSFVATASNEIKNVMLTIEDPKFAAVAAASNTGSLLDDETLLSPVDSLISSSSDELKESRKKLNGSPLTSNSKDINEKATPPSPGTPTNASNSLSLSDGKDDFLIDDEIADQPALVFEDTLTGAGGNDSVYSSRSQNDSESTPTLMESSLKQRRRVLGAFEGSPLSIRNKKFLRSRTGSLDTLSPCESIASDDLMMDYDYSQSSGLEDCDNTGNASLNEAAVLKNEAEMLKRGLKDWSLLIGSSSIISERMQKSNGGGVSRSRLLRSRTGTPAPAPDSPRSLDGGGRARALARPSATSSPLRPRIGHHPHGTGGGGIGGGVGGYDSDDSVRTDRANHTAMKQDIMSIKTMLLKLRRVLNESETHNPFENQLCLTNGLLNGSRDTGVAAVECPASSAEENETEARLELADLRRQVLFLHGQLEDREKTVQSLQDQMVKLADDGYRSNSAPASTIVTESQTCNAATQTERIRPISAGPSLLNGSSVDGNAGSLVSASESIYSSSRKSRPPFQIADPNLSTASKRTPSRLWRQPGEPPSPQRYAVGSGLSSIPRRANSRSRILQPASSPS